MLYVSAAPGQDAHDTGPSHPERPQRVTAALDGLRRAALGDAVEQVEPRLATRRELEQVHTSAYLDWLEGYCAAGGGQVDADTVAATGSWATALAAVGGALAAVDRLSESGEGVAFAAHRPPGHHATADQAMGFCLLNTIAVVAATLVSRGDRVMVLDWDVHHGNGTEAIFWDNPEVLYVSTHQAPLYPGTGGAAAIGGPNARGTNLNIPVPPGATGDVMAYAYDELVAPAVATFGPQWCLVSCGFDAHQSDPLAQLALSAGDFADMALRARSFAGGPGRTLVVLEGGYNLEAISRSTGAVFSALAGGTYRPEPATSGGPGRSAVDAAAGEQRRALEG